MCYESRSYHSKELYDDHEKGQGNRAYYPIAYAMVAQAFGWVKRKVD
jgi:hypothetical protein